MTKKKLNNKIINKFNYLIVDAILEEYNLESTTK
jgi:hypothetical protein